MKQTTQQKAIKLARRIKSDLDQVQFDGLQMKCHIDKLNKRAFRLERDLVKLIDENF
jgi:uncharacterized protein YwgA